MAKVIIEIVDNEDLSDMDVTITFDPPLTGDLDERLTPAQLMANFMLNGASEWVSGEGKQ